jgi:cell wall-associated NlpC family hydrolase
MFVHSPKTGGRVSEASFQNVYWRQAFVGGRRIVF